MDFDRAACGACEDTGLIGGIQPCDCAAAGVGVSPLAAEIAEPAQGSARCPAVLVVNDPPGQRRCTKQEGHDPEGPPNHEFEPAAAPPKPAGPASHVVVLAALHVVADTARSRGLIVAEFIGGVLGMVERIMVMGDGAGELLIGLADGLTRVAARSQQGPERSACDVVGRGLRALAWFAVDRPGDARLHFPYLQDGEDRAHRTVTATLRAVFGEEKRAAGEAVQP